MIDNNTKRELRTAEDIAGLSAEMAELLNAADVLPEVRRMLADMNASNWTRMRNRLLEMCGCDD